MFLFLPAKQLCATPRAQFAFHATFGAATPADDKYNNRAMMAMYPPWVRDWIKGNGGLTKKLLVMDWPYIRRFMKTCKTESAAN